MVPMDVEYEETGNSLGGSVSRVCVGSRSGVAAVWTGKFQLRKKKVCVADCAATAAAVVSCKRRRLNRSGAFVVSHPAFARESATAPLAFSVDPSLGVDATGRCDGVENEESVVGVGMDEGGEDGGLDATGSGDNVEETVSNISQFRDSYTVRRSVPLRRSRRIAALRPRRSARLASKPRVCYKGMC